jgi:hypothetical protein
MHYSLLSYRTLHISFMTRRDNLDSIKAIYLTTLIQILKFTYTDVTYSYDHQPVLNYHNIHWHVLNKISD